MPETAHATYTRCCDWLRAHGVTGIVFDAMSDSVARVARGAEYEPPRLKLLQRSP